MIDFARAECKEAPSEWWDQPYGDGAARAKLICSGCPIREQCGAEGARVKHTVGIWGGTYHGLNGESW